MPALYARRHACQDAGKQGLFTLRPTNVAAVSEWMQAKARAARFGSVK